MVTNIIMTAVVFIASVLVARYYLHMFQLESYQLDGYIRWLKKNHDKHLGWTLNIGVGSVAVYYVLVLFLKLFVKDAAALVSGIITLLVFAAGTFLVDRGLHSAPEKKPLVYTARMKRLYAALALIAALLSLIIYFIGIDMLSPLLFVAVPYLALAAGLAMQPVEKAISGWYLNDAKKKLEAREDLIKIGITGSYGKTSTKFILATILSEKYDVLATPSSFNTPMGLTRVIREQLADHHEVFLAEMGARHVGDIAELVDLVHPKYGVLTSVGAQHLETFGDVETVANTKFELIEGLPEDGAGFFAADGAEVDKLFERATVKKFRAGLRGALLDMYAEEIEVGPEGCSFMLKNSLGEKVSCRTRMLGRHNIQNIVLACSLARHLGLTMEQIARGVSKLEPVEHRLQLIPGAGGITVIDDAFNSNPVGAKAALDVLSAFPGRHIVVTPGMVEQGEQEEEINRQFGTQMAYVCDVVILVGKKRTLPIREGLLNGGMDEDNICSVNTLDEASAILGQIGRAGDTVLFENDLPDNYSEKQ